MDHFSATAGTGLNQFRIKFLKFSEVFLMFSKNTQA